MGTMAAGERWTFLDGEWRQGSVPLMTSSTHAAWLGSVVFDGARHFDGMAPDMDRHCQRVVDSARTLGMEPSMSCDEILGLVVDGVKRFAPGAPLYVRPMFWAESGFIDPDPASTRFALVMSVSPLPEPKGFSACLVPFERPVPNAAPTKAKAACHYPNLGLAMRAAKARGYDAGVITDGLGNIAEFAFANLMFGKQGEVHTPAANGTFLNGITRQRVISLLRADGVVVHERAIEPEDLRGADEIFNTGNYGKVMPCTRYEDRDLQPGPLYRRARALYWDFAATAR